MKSIDVPARFPIPFAAAAGPGFTRTVPRLSQVGIQDGAASLETGFPPLTFLPIASGGARPFGQDYNGLLNLITLWNRWQGAGGPVQYDAAFSTAIGGYPRGAVLAAATFALFWISNVDDNASNPETGGAGWSAFRLAVPSVIVTASTTLNMSLVTGRYGLNRAVTPAAMAINLPTVTDQHAGMEWKVVDLFGNLQGFPATVAPPGGHTISGRTTYVMDQDYQSATFAFFGGTTWSVET